MPQATFLVCGIIANNSLYLDYSIYRTPRAPRGSRGPRGARGKPKGLDDDPPS